MTGQRLGNAPKGVFMEFRRRGVRNHDRVIAPFNGFRTGEVRRNLLEALYGCLKFRSPGFPGAVVARYGELECIGQRNRTKALKFVSEGPRIASPEYESQDVRVCQGDPTRLAICRAPVRETESALLPEAVTKKARDIRTTGSADQGSRGGQRK